MFKSLEKNNKKITLMILLKTMQKQVEKKILGSEILRQIITLDDDGGSTDVISVNRDTNTILGNGNRDSNKISGNCNTNKISSDSGKIFGTSKEISDDGGGDTNRISDNGDGNGNTIVISDDSNGNGNTNRIFNDSNDNNISDTDDPPDSEEENNLLNLLVTAENIGEIKKKERRSTIKECKVIIIEEVKESVGNLTKVPTDLHEVQPRPDKVWNYDKIDINPNSKWHRIICTFKWCATDKIWKTVEGKTAPFCMTILFFSRADG